MVYAMPGTSPSQSEAGPAVAAERVILCPYCGTSSSGKRCAACGGLFEPLSMQATQNEMGPWFIRDAVNPFRPGCSHQTLRRLAERGKIGPETVMRGPTTRQFWSLARNVRGVAHLLGECHNCHGPASADEYMCRNCGAVFEAPKDRQHFGAGPVRLIPGQAPPEVVARATMPARAESTARPAPKQHIAAAAPSRSPDQASQSAVRAMRRRLAQMRRIVTISIAVNVVLFAAIIATSLASKLSLRGGAPEAELPQNTGNTAPVAVPPTSDGMRAVFAEAQRLAASDDADDWRRAEGLLVEAMQNIPTDQRPEDAVELLTQIRDRIDQRSLEQFLPTEPEI